MNSNILHFREVTREFPGVVAMDRVPFAVEQGEIHSTCGANGAGKSTLMEILAVYVDMATKKK